MLFVMLCGLPASGKSTYAKKLMDTELSVGGTVEIISSDQIRGEVNGDEASQGNPILVWDIFYKRAISSSSSTVILDATFLTRKDRQRTVQAIRTERKKLGKKDTFIAVAFTPNLEVSKQRNAARSRKVPESVIESMASRYTLPEVKEGFSTILVVKTGEEL